MVMNRPKIKIITSQFIVLVVGFMLLTSCSQNENDVVHENVIIKIGVGSFDDAMYGHSRLKKNLEDRFNIEIQFIELASAARSTDEYVNRIDLALQNDEIDIAIGLPSYLMPQLITNNRLLDLTDHLVDLENIHRGVVDMAKVMGDGRIYFISPVIQDISLVFSNQKILNELGLDNLPKYVSWDDFLSALDYCNTAIDMSQIDYSPIALSIGERQGENLMIAHEFLMQNTVLSQHLIENNVLNHSSIKLYEVFAKIVAKYGKTNAELLNGIYPKNLIFTEGNFTYMVSDVSDLEILLNFEYNDKFNSDSPLEIKADFPIGVSIINFDGSKKQNLKETSIIVNRNTEYKDVAIELLNYLMGKELANNMIENRSEYSYFTSFRYTFPSYFDEETIARLNKAYNGNFDVSLFYDVEYGNIIKGMYITNRELVDLLNIGFTQIYNAYKDDLYYDIDSTIAESISYINNNIMN